MLTQFDLGSAARVARVVRTVEGQGPKAKPLTFDPFFEQSRRPMFRIGTFSAEWTKGESQTVTFKFQTTTPNTVTATNLFADVPSGGDCAIAKEGTAWFLIAAECST